MHKKIIFHISTVHVIIFVLNQENVIVKVPKYYHDSPMRQNKNQNEEVDGKIVIIIHAYIFVDWEVLGRTFFSLYINEMYSRHRIYGRNSAKFELQHLLFEFHC